MAEIFPLFCHANLLSSSIFDLRSIEYGFPVGFLFFFAHDGHGDDLRRNRRFLDEKLYAGCRRLGVADHRRSRDDILAVGHRGGEPAHGGPRHGSRQCPGLGILDVPGL